MTVDDVPDTFKAHPDGGAQPRTLAEVRSRIQRPRRQVALYLDAEAASQIEEAERALEAAQEYDETTNEPDTAPTLAQHLRALETRADESRTLFTLQAIPHRTYQKLRAANPPTQAQIEAAAKAGGEGEPAFDPDAFAPALVRAQLIDPAVDSDEDFDGFWEELSDGQLNQLWTAALAVQLGVTDPGPKSETASEVLRSFGIS